MIRKKEFIFAFQVSIPVMMGYIVLGFAFRLLAVSFELSVFIATLMSIFIYAGALQFVAIGFFKAKLGLFDMFVAAIFINIRQSFYGLSLLKRFRNTKKLKPYLIFALTDETYALLTTIKEPFGLKKRYYYFYLSALNQSYWVIGTILGSLFGSFINFDTKGIDFSLTALFVVLVIEQYKANNTPYPFIIGGIVSIIAISTVSIDNMLITSIILALISMFIFKKRLVDE